MQVEALVESQSQALALPLLGQLAHLQAPGGQEQDPPHLECQLTPYTIIAHGIGARFCAATTIWLQSIPSRLNERQ